MEKLPEWLSIIPGIATGMIGLCTFYWGNVRTRSQHVSIIELATKRLAFWELCLKVAGSAADPADEKFIKLRDEAFMAIGKISDDASAELKLVSWNDSTTRQAISGRSPLWRLITIKPDSSLSSFQKFEYVYLKLFSWFMLILFVLIVDVLVQFLIATPSPTLKQTFAVVGLACFGIFCSYLGGAFQLQADKLKYQRPKPPIIETI